MPVSFDLPGLHTTPATLATANLPRRVRRVLEHLLSLVSDEMARHLGQMLSDVEQQLFRLADHARNPGLQSGHMDTLRTLRLNRSDLVPRYLMGLESVLASLRDPRPLAQSQNEATTPNFRNLSLIDDESMDEETVLRQIALRFESRASLPLHLLGQRFGVLAGAPAFDAERLPVGPQMLGRVLRDASLGLQIGVEARLLVYRTYERVVMAHYTQLAETMNALLEREGILPSLAYVPIRARPVLQNPGPDKDGAPEGGGQPASGTGGERASRQGPGGTASERDGNRPHTAWLGQPNATDTAFDEKAAFEILQQLLSGRRDLIGKLRPGQKERPRQALSTGEVLGALDGMRSASGAPAGGARTPLEVKQALLAQSRQVHGRASTLAREDNDAFELMGMLYSQIEREVRRDTPAVGMLGQLQLPLLRVALQDRAFFVRPQHPARQLLNAVAESGASWMADGDVDPQLVQALGQAVEHVSTHYQDDPRVFETAYEDLQSNLQQIARKAEVTERRHVEAARGKEKLELAKRRATDTIDAAVRDQRMPRFVRALLNQAWADVLTLTLLRHGEESEEWQRQLDATQHIVEATGKGGAPADPALADQIQRALVQVGYHVDEASAIGRRLTTGLDEDDDDPASRTELAMKLKARARLGEDTARPREQLPPRTPEEQAAYEHLRTLPFGTWFEFVNNQQGDRVRRRLSWYSPVTDNALFVNQRGQRVGEQSLDSLARMMARGQAQVVTAERGRLVDRAWQGALSALRSFAGSGPSPQEAGA